MKKRILLVMLSFVLVFTAGSAFPASFEYAIMISDNYHNADTNLTDHRILAGAGLDSTTTYDVWVDNLPQNSSTSEVKKKLIHIPGWDVFLPGHSYVRSFPTGAGWPSPSSSLWDQRSYHFFIDEDNSGDHTTGEPDEYAYIPEFAIKQMDVVGSVNISGGYNPTISWNGVADAEVYKVRLFALNTDGSINSNVLLYNSEIDDDDRVGPYSHPYSGGLFFDYGTMAVDVEAWDITKDDIYDDGFGNRSRYLKLHNPIPIPSAVWLLGSGLVGLVGLRKKVKK